MAMSTFSPVGSQYGYENVCVCVMLVCVVHVYVHVYVWTEWTWNLKYTLHWHIHISVHSILCQYYARTHKHILKTFEDRKLTGLKVDIAHIII